MIQQKESDLVYSNLPSAIRDLISKPLRHLTSLDYAETHSKEESAAVDDEAFVPSCSSNEP